MYSLLYNSMKTSLSEPLSKPIVKLMLIFTLFFSVVITGSTAGIESNTIKNDNTKEVVDRVENYVDKFFTGFLAKNHTPGVSFILVDKNGALLTKGYGKSKFENGQAIDPQKHLFRIASITKTMTALGVMKLVNENKIDIDANVNNYFTRFQIPDTFESPVTVRHLLMHTSGISDTFAELNFSDIAEKRNMGDFLEKHIPQRLFPPGKYGGYTNRAYMLLGHIIEEVSGEAYEDWMRDNVFKPLGMNNTGFYLSKEQAPWLAEGTLFIDGQYKKQTSVDTITRPSGDAISTAVDMGRYATMLLNNGVIDGKNFLNKETVNRIFNDCFSFHPGMSKGCISFHKSVLPDENLRFEHGGYYGGWYADFAFFPELGFGYFVGSNGDDEFTKEFRKGIAEQITGSTFNAKSDYIFSKKIDRADELVGNYRSQFLGATFEKIYHLFSGDSIISLKDSATLSFQGQDYQQVDPLVLRSLQTGSLLVFEQNEHGKIINAISGGGWFGVNAKLTFWQQTNFQLSWLRYALYFCLFALVIFPITSIVLAKNKAKMQGTLVSKNTIILVIASVSNFLWLSPLALLWLTNTTDLMSITLGLTWPMKTAFVLIDLAVIFAVLLSLFTLKNIFSTKQARIIRFMLLIMSINSLSLIFWSNYWNLF